MSGLSHTAPAAVLPIFVPEDVVTSLPDAELMKQNIPGSQMKVIAKAGHFSPWEQPEEVGKLLRNFLNGIHRA